jgi:thiamine-monophosphate kinase
MSGMELEFIRWLRQRIPSHPAVRIGIGDDAAVMASPSNLVVTTDMLMDGVDFQLASVDPRRIGHKALAVNLSDLAAMAARPLAAFVSLALPQADQTRGLNAERAGGLEQPSGSGRHAERAGNVGDFGNSVVGAIYEGLLTIAESFDVAIAGGDTNSWNGPLVISLTALGQATGRGPLLRSGARPGDEIVATGDFGGSILGHHLDFMPRVREALWLHEHFELHAGIDVSDGLSLDLARLAEASDCGAALEVERVPVSAAARQLAAAQPGGPPAVEHALGDGEDFELLLAVPPDEAERLVRSPSLPVRVTRIGHFVQQPGLWRIGAGGALLPLPPRGYEHRVT